MNHCVRRYIANELKGWKPLEVLWLIGATGIVFAVSVCFGDTVAGILAATTGVLCVILTGKGKLTSYLFGIVSTALYAYISYDAKYYGQVMLNALYYVPMNVVGWFLWNRHINSDTGEVERKRLSPKADSLVALLTVFTVVAYGLVLHKMGGRQTVIDSLTTIMSVVAQILCVKRYMEQWVLWIIVNALTTALWLTALAGGGGSIAMVLMWTVYLLNSIFMFVKWYKMSPHNAH